MKTLNLVAHFPKGYIGDPYWTARASLIDIQKQSGMNRAKSDANRRKALEDHLKRLGMTLADYQALETEASKPFYTNEEGRIIIPELHVFGMMVAACDEARSAMRPCPPEQIRSRFIVTPWLTDRTAPDGCWERFALVSTGTGQKLSNQRGLRRSYYIADFDATGSISFNETFVKPAVLKELIEFAGDNIGVGASRKMGWGKWIVTKWWE